MATNKKFSFRLDEELKEKITQKVEDRKDLYSSPSHFIRAAVIRELRRIKK